MHCFPYLKRTNQHQAIRSCNPVAAASSDLSRLQDPRSTIRLQHRPSCWSLYPKLLSCHISKPGWDWKQFRDWSRCHSFIFQEFVAMMKSFEVSDLSWSLPACSCDCLLTMSCILSIRRSLAWSIYLLRWASDSIPYLQDLCYSAPEITKRHPLCWEHIHQDSLRLICLHDSSALRLLLIMPEK